MKIKKFKIPFYHGYLFICQHKNIYEIAEKIGAELNGGAEAFYYSDNYKYYLCIKPKATQGTIAHEALHIVHSICHDNGIKPDFENDEPLCVMIDWVVEKTNKAIKTWENSIQKDLH